MGTKPRLTGLIQAFLGFRKADVAPSSIRFFTFMPAPPYAIGYTAQSLGTNALSAKRLH